MADAYLFTQLKKLDLFDSVSGDDLVKILDKYMFSIYSCPKGSLVMSAGTGYDELIIIVKGRLSASMQGPQGKVLIVDCLEAVTSAAAPFLFSARNSLPVNLVADIDSKLIRIKKDILIDIACDHPSVMNNILSDMGNRVSFLTEKIKMFQFSTIRQKVLSHILSLYNEQKNLGVVLPYTKERLAELMGVTRPALSREFSILSKEGFFKTMGRKIEIANLDKMKLELEKY